ncbi:MAG: T9SS type A sorting domain-containing protein, partial [Ignavibacteria bacterium]
SNGDGVWKRPLSEMILTSGEGNSAEVPSKYNLNQNYPNPFNPSTNIKFTAANSGVVNITVFDVKGQKVEELVNSSYNPGTYEVKWNASKYSSGIYFYTMKTDKYSETKRMLLVK